MEDDTFIELKCFKKEPKIISVVRFGYMMN